MSTSMDKTVRVWDVARTEVIVRDRDLVITAALMHGIGFQTLSESDHFLIQNIPEDLYAEAFAKVGDRADIVIELDAVLHKPLHLNCYLSPTQFADKFGQSAILT